MQAQPPVTPSSIAPLGPREFVALVACMMAMTALGIDSMLPALPHIGETFALANANDQQWVIAFFMFGFAGGQLLWGPLSDRFGRRPILLVTLTLGAIFNAIAAFSASYELLLAARFASGLAVASSRVVTVALVRDCFSGRAMARVMSLAFIVFMAAPVLAPTVGTLVMLVAPWRWIFWLLAAAATATLAWVSLRLPETLHAEDRLPLSLTRLARGTKFALTERTSIGYTIAMACVSAGLFGFINSISQVLDVVFGAADRLAIVFASVAGLMACANLLNSRIVMRFGTRLISHTALLGFILFALVHLGFALSGAETLWSFVIVQALMMGCFGLSTANFGAMAMDNMGHIAGTASSVQGFISTAGGAIGGILIGQAFDGTTIPLYTGFLIGGLTALAAVLITERGRLFRAHHPV
jgi:DHA1 family bicyclomycin/chloramphenicol resistance-like MFS transporter